MYASFEEVSGLSQIEALELLETGDQTERVWAAWTLGMRLAGESRADLSERLDGEPTRGVRQHLAVVLAGLGATETLAAIATTDPSLEVRVTAGQLCTRLLDSAAGDIARRLCARLDREATPELAAAVLAEVRADGPALLRERVDRSIRSEHLELRRAAAAAVLRWDADGFRADLREPALLEPDDELAAELLGQWCARAGVAEVIGCLEGHEPRVIARNLRRLASIAPLPWSLLERFATAGHPGLTEAVLDAVSDLDAAGWRWLLALVERSDAASRRLDVIDEPIRARAIARLRELSPNPAAASLSYVDRTFLEAAERLVDQAEGGQALVPRSRSVWWGLRIVADRGAWLDLARRMFPEIREVELVCHECGDGELNLVGYCDGDRACIVAYVDIDERVAADLLRVETAARGRELARARESEL